MSRFRAIPAALLLIGIVNVVLGVGVVAGWPVALIALGIICVAAAIEEVYR